MKSYKETNALRIKANIVEVTKLNKKMIDNDASSHDLIRLSFLHGMISEEEYFDYLNIEEFCKDT